MQGIESLHESHIILNGLKPCIRQFVLWQNPGTIQELTQSAKLAQLTVVDNSI
jgi:hypothetical protein